MPRTILGGRLNEIMSGAQDNSVRMASTAFISLREHFQDTAMITGILGREREPGPERSRSFKPSIEPEPTQAR
jgi:hypothetical protein